MFLVPRIRAECKFPSLAIFLLIHCTPQCNWLYSNGIQPFEGQDIFHLVRGFLSEFLDLTDFSRGDFLASSPPGDPIEKCFVDISKTMPINEQIVSEYFTKLIPGKSIVIQQDYLFQSPPWDIATMEILGDHFDLLSYTEENSAEWRAWRFTNRLGVAEKVYEKVCRDSAT